MRFIGYEMKQTLRWGETERLFGVNGACVRVNQRLCLRAKKRTLVRNA